MRMMEEGEVATAPPEPGSAPPRHVTEAKGVTLTVSCTGRSPTLDHYELVKHSAMSYSINNGFDYMSWTLSHEASLHLHAAEFDRAERPAHCALSPEQI